MLPAPRLDFNERSRVRRRIPARFVPGHPLAGREVSGPAAARADLFADRVWALTPSAATDPERTAQVARAGREPGCRRRADHARGARPGGRAHLAHARRSCPPWSRPGSTASATAEVRLSGQGLRDVTRLAGSDPDLWTEILTSNAEPVSAALDGLIERLAVGPRRAARRGWRTGVGARGAERRRAGRRQGPRQARDRAGAPTPWSRSSSRTARASWAPVRLRGAGPGSTWRTCGSTTPRADRPVWSSSRCGRGVAALLADGLREDGFEVRD